MEFISIKDIERIQASITDEHILMAFMGHVDYFFLLDDGEGVASMPAQMVGARYTGDSEAPFYIDLVVKTPTEDVFVLLRNLHANSLNLASRSTDEHAGVGIAQVHEIEKIMEIVNAPRFSDGLRLVHSRGDGK
jgi:hypothetical protein